MEIELKNALKRYSFYSLQQYRTRYILAKIAQFVDMAFTGISSPSSLNDYTNLEIEHILPNTPNEGLLAKFKEDSPEKEYHSYKMKLGNLTLLEKPINIVAGRKFFSNKCSEYSQSKCYLTSSLTRLAEIGKNSSITRINEFLFSPNNWGAEEIDERQKRLISLSEKIWHIEELK
jgi:hypothetical protein